jgi:hypothetical protein
MRPLTILISCLLSLNAYCQTIFWTGAVSSDWNDVANWSQPYVSGMNVVIDPLSFSGAMLSPDPVFSAFTPNDVTVTNGAVLPVGSLMATGQVEVSGSGTQLILNGSLIQNAVLPGTGIRFSNGAHFEMVSGTFGAGYQLEFLSGATGAMLAGNLTVYWDLIIDGGNTNNASAFEQHGGSILVSRNVILSNTTAGHTPAFAKDDGTFVIDGDLLWSGGTSDSGQGRFIVSGGSVQLQGDLKQTLPATLRVYLELAGNAAQFSKHGNSVTMMMSEDSIRIVDDAGWYDYDSVSWHNEGNLWADASVYFVSGDSQWGGNGVYQFSDIWVSAMRSVTVVTVEPVYISRNFTFMQNALFESGTGKIVLNGTEHQYVIAGDTLTFHDLEINNHANGPADGGYGVTLSHSIAVTHDLSFVDGVLNGGVVNSVTVRDNAGVTGSAASFLQGKMVKIGDDPTLFPLGEAPDTYRPVTITAPASTATAVAIRYVSQPYSSLSPVEGPLQSVSAAEYWNIQRTGSADLFAVNAAWNNSVADSLPDCDDLALSVWNGSEWLYIPATPGAACSGNGSGELSSGELPWIGPVTFGFLNAVIQQQVDVCAGETYMVGTHDYDESGVYVDTFQNVYGNDSIVYTTLTVADPLHLAVVNNVVTLESQQSPGSYQWIDCATGMPVPGAVGATFAPAENGSYAVILTQGACSDTSDCYIIDQLGLFDGAALEGSFYPNPVKDILTISANASVPEEVEVHTLAGVPVRVAIYAGAPGTEIDFSLQPSGLYLVRATVDGEHHAWRIVKQ